MPDSRMSQSATSHEPTETRVPILCEWDQGDPAEHVICKECGDDWDECECGARDDRDVSWMLSGMMDVLVAQRALRGHSDA